MATKKNSKSQLVGWVVYKSEEIKRNQNIRVGDVSSRKQADVRVNGDGLLITPNGLVLEWSPTHYIVCPDLPFVDKDK